MPLKCVEDESESAKSWLEKCNKGIMIDYHYYKYGEVGCVMPSCYKGMADYFLNFTVRPDDIWVIGFPKSGTTWTQELVWLIGHKLDFKGAEESLDYCRFPYFEREWVTRWRCKLPEGNKLDLSIEQTPMAHVDKMESPRYIKSHLHSELLPTGIHSVKPKIIYVARNAKDVVVSYFNFQQLINNFLGTMDEFVDSFITDNVTYAPYWGNLKDFWKIRDQENILFLTYEEMKKELPKVICRVAKFMNVELTEEEVEKLATHLSFNQMKNNPAVNKMDQFAHAKRSHGVSVDHGFIRKGQIGSWKEELSPASIKKLDEWIAVNKIPGLHDEYY